MRYKLPGWPSAPHAAETSAAAAKAQSPKTANHRKPRDTIPQPSARNDTDATSYTRRLYTPYITT